ncbi:hypothetical protein AVEN_239882-1 [Araneus ventricosus]|uniref:RNase H type-1 domain-containing protein n=1 Tax=Araneus ventricosus TaxID=182803 RepID=A0A4Y2LAG1_ARAVE|nr:hypothetical protein AVEN_239882-1 [Araneus ventricosus]
MQQTKHLNYKERCEFNRLNWSSCLGIVASSCQRELIVGLLCLAMFLNGFAFSGFNVTHVDMSADFSGVLFGITNSVANTAGILTPMIVGFLTASGTLREVREIKLRNPDNCSVFRSELLAIEAGLEAILNENNYGAVWILSDSRSSIQHLKDWNNVGDRTGISILKLLRHIGVDHEVHLQWIPSHVDIYGNEVADNLAKQGTAEPLCSTPSLTFDEIYSIRKNKDLKTWRVPPYHDWYKRSSPGAPLALPVTEPTRLCCPDLSAFT